MEPISDLYLFREIVRAGSFVGAAQSLGMSPSGISKRLSRFETKLGVRLFNRTTRALALTESGESLFGHAETIINAIDEAENNARALANHPKGNLRVACSDAFALNIIVPMLKTFQAAYPEVSVTIVQGDGPLDILTEQIDLAIRFEPPTNANFVARQLIADPWVLCASPAYLANHGTPQCVSDLSDHRCMTISARHREDNVWGFTSKSGTQTTTIDSCFSAIGLVVKHAALQGLGIARVANFLVSQEIETGTLIRLLPDHQPAQDRSIFAVYPNREYLPLKVRVFIDALVQRLAV